MRWGHTKWVGVGWEVRVGEHAWCGMARQGGGGREGWMHYRNRSRSILVSPPLALVFPAKGQLASPRPSS